MYSCCDNTLAVHQTLTLSDGEIDIPIHRRPRRDHQRGLAIKRLYWYAEILFDHGPAIRSFQSTAGRRNGYRSTGDRPRLSMATIGIPWRSDQSLSRLAVAWSITRPLRSPIGSTNRPSTLSAPPAFATGCRNVASRSRRGCGHCDQNRVTLLMDTSARN